MAYIINSLAQYEVHVARYYFSRGAYLAAISRAQQAITDYQGAPAQEEALFVMVRAYDALGMKDLAADTRRILEKTYPNTRLLGGSGGSAGDKAPKDPWWKLW
jgi:outer membrane protein assembly factor BamD